MVEAAAFSLLEDIAKNHSLPAASSPSLRAAQQYVGNGPETVVWTDRDGVRFRGLSAAPTIAVDAEIDQ